jgi:DNA polymerase-1
LNTLLIDADVLAYQFAFRNTESWKWDEEDEEVTERLQPEKAKKEVELFIGDLRDHLKGDEVHIILSDRKENFRKQLEPTYKATRKAKPTLWEDMRSYLEDSSAHGFPVHHLPRLEGDDVLGIMGTHPKRGRRSIIVSIDKDMKTVPCRLFLFNKPDDGVRHIDRDEAVRFHMLQTLTGDAVDEYKGIPGVGPKKAERHLDGVPREDLWDAVVELYSKYNMTEEDALLQARLAYILQHGDYRKGGIRLWKPKLNTRP